MGLVFGGCKKKFRVVGYDCWNVVRIRPVPESLSGFEALPVKPRCTALLEVIFGSSSGIFREYRWEEKV